MTRIVGLLLACASLTLACAGEAKPAGNVDVLSARLAEEAVGCSELRREEPSALVKEKASCLLPSGRTLELFIFASTAKRDQWAVLGTQLRPAALGPDWAISGERADVERVAGALSAELVLPEDGR
jgi:hypothetical protein